MSINLLANTSFKWKEGLSGFQLKYMALFFMLLDHIEYIFGYTGRIPVWFSWIGRLAAPIFLFCVIEGFMHTHDRKSYFLRIYLLSVVMGLIRFSFYNVAAGLVRADGFFPQNAMLSSFAILLVVLQGVDWCRQKKFGRGIACVVLPCILPYVMAFCIYQPLAASEHHTALFWMNMLNFSVLPLHASIMDGGTAVLIQGIVLYFFHESRKKQVTAFALAVLILDIVTIVLYAPDISLHALVFDYYEWMELFAILPMLLYNGKRGKGNKALFYWFYPIHIYVLYLLSLLFVHFS